MRPTRCTCPTTSELDVHQQCAGFTTLREWNFTADTAYPLLLYEPYVRLYPSQVVKQADLVLAMHWRSYAFSAEQKARNVDYYEPRTARDSSLSAATQAVMCAEVGHLELAHDYAYEAALIDLRDLNHNTRDGLHLASLAGAWTALVAGFGGLRDDEGVLALDPCLPDGITRLRFRLCWKDFRLCVDISRAEVTYSLRDEAEGQLTIRHAGTDLKLSTHSPRSIRSPRRRAVPARPSRRGENQFTAGSARPRTDRCPHDHLEGRTDADHPAPRAPGLEGARAAPRRDRRAAPARAVRRGPGRGERLTAEAAGLYLDYSKNRITDETLAPAARSWPRSPACASARDAMFRGERINVSENRSRAARRAADAEGRARWSSTASTSSRRCTRCSTGWPRSPTGSAPASGRATPASRSATSSTSASAAPTSAR